MPGARISTRGRGGRPGSPARSCATAARHVRAAVAQLSWCYGTPGLARAQQLVGIATGNNTRQNMAEQALAGCLSDPAQLGRIGDTSLCHGWAGLYQTTWRAAGDACTPAIAARLPQLADLVTRRARPGAGDGTGLLEGDAGLALALHTAARATPPASDWDACLLIN